MQISTPLVSPLSRSDGSSARAVAPPPQASSGETAGVAVSPVSSQAVSAVDKEKETSNSRDATKKPVSLSDLQPALRKLNEAVQHYDSELEFSVDKDTDISVVKVVDKETQKVIRQIPSEEAISISKAIEDFKGLLIKDKA
ncbi:flagellar protein FlaG [Pseudogulbenkiania ferrooxidans]|uniref:Flagellar protein FlaG protein n=1 Tax=Pseudogulbenkiania ferrooxidans 2002 TaxID=279714 RepID=B9Z884_9NEIS|nr:flagellar protein FlaG [Pseudogulbenkiania ferrooxidans]EEG06987.1 flagellar protein FlaG protein [Pseudogulbenkiania ferrooxidans 2002]